MTAENQTAAEEMTFPVNVVQKVPRSMVQNALVGLFENGCSSWLRSAKNYEFPSGVTEADFRNGGKFAEEDNYPALVVPLTPGCKLVMAVDNPTSDGPDVISFKMGIEEIAKGLQIMADKCPKEFANLVTENDDANTHDLLGQYIVYGEEVYC